MINAMAKTQKMHSPDLDKNSFLDLQISRPSKTSRFMYNCKRQVLGNEYLLSRNVSIWQYSPIGKSIEKKRENYLYTCGDYFAVLD